MEPSKKLPIPLSASATLGETVQDHVSRRLVELGILPSPKASIPLPDRDEQLAYVMRTAIENQKYYLQVEKETGNPWFQNPRTQHIYSEHVLVTPQMIPILLEFNVANRPIVESYVDSCARDIVNDRWLQSGECFKIDWFGNFFDGQHRAKAIVKANKPNPVYITWNLPPEARFIVDSGRKRNINEKLEMIVGDSCGLGNKKSAVCKAMMMGISYRGYRFTESEIAAFIEIHKDTLCWLAKNMPGVRADVQAVIGKALLWHGESVVFPFCEKFTKMVFPKEGDPVGMLYRYLQRTKNQRGHIAPGLLVYKRTLSAFEHFINNRMVAKLHDRGEDIFEWEKGWSVPNSAPKNNQ